MGRNQNELKGEYDWTFPKRLREEMANRSISQTELAEYLGVTPQAVGRYCRGETGIDLPKLIKIADKLEVTVDYLLRENGIKGSDPDMAMISEYTGLSGKSVEVLHSLHKGKTITGKAYDTDSEGNRTLIEETYKGTPNKKALTAINALLEYSPFDDEPETGEEEDLYTEADYLFETDPPEVWSFFTFVYHLIFPQEPLFSEDPEYNQYLIEKSLKSIIEEMRLKKNPEYGAYGLSWRLRQMDLRNAQVDKEMKTFQEKQENLDKRMAEVKEGLQSVMSMQSLLKEISSHRKTPDLNEDK